MKTSLLFFVSNISISVFPLFIRDQQHNSQQEVNGMPLYAPMSVIKECLTSDINFQVFIFISKE